jgi:hypothetical protein
LNILNLFDQKTVTNVYTILNLSTSVITATNLNGGVKALNDATFVNPYVAGALLGKINTYLAGTPTILNRKDARYGQPSTFQGPRGVRFGFRLIF